jgi:hypothetical protein
MTQLAKFQQTGILFPKWLLEPGFLEHVLDFTKAPKMVIVEDTLTLDPGFEEAIHLDALNKNPFWDKHDSQRLYSRITEAKEYYGSCLDTPKLETFLHRPADRFLADLATSEVRRQDTLNASYGRPTFKGVMLHYLGQTPLFLN